MKVIYIIGGMCNGKSTIGRALEERGAKFIDLDLLANEGQKEQACIAELAKLGVDGLVEGGKVNRSVMLDYLFSSSFATKRVDEAIHPIVKELLDKKLEALEKEGYKTVVVEYTGYYGEPRDKDIFLKDADFVVWIESSLKDKIERASKRDLPAHELTWRMRVQPYDEEYEAVADYTIHNNDTKEALNDSVEQLWSCCS